MREKERNSNRERERNRDRDKDSDRNRNEDRERSYQDSDERNRKNDHRYSSRSRSRSKCLKGSSDVKCEYRANPDKSEKSKSVNSRTRSSLRNTSIKRESSPTKTNDNVKAQTDEKIAPSDDKELSERARILEKWRSNFCETSEDITRKLEELAEDNDKECWIRSSPADLYYKRTSINEIEGTPRLEALCTLFKTELVDRGKRARQSKPVVEEKTKKRRHRVCRHKSKTQHFIHLSNCISTIQYSH